MILGKSVCVLCFTKWFDEYNYFPYALYLDNFVSKTNEKYSELVGLWTMSIIRNCKYWKTQCF
jgi:hypothetical protein